jgi:deoxyribodipyrimidine photo-lyase
VQRLGEKGLIWLKRDLRVRDHAPLSDGLRLGATQALFIFEPAWLQSPECSEQHLQFAKDSLAELEINLKTLGIELLLRSGTASDVLQEVLSQTPFTHLLSHEETGSGWSYERDRAVANWCQQLGIEWREYPQTGVVRRLKTRLGWARRWATRMDSPVASAGELVSIDLTQHASTKRSATPAGERAAWSVLESFLAGRAADYRRAMSSPQSAEHSCSRLSAHLAFGTISMRSVHQATEQAIADYQSMGERKLAFALRSFAGRLRWHCHFMQKLEDEPAIEFKNFSRSADSLRREVFNDEDQRRFTAWSTGQTGFPMVDACMRSLLATGWLNFRMRAMLVSFASYHLWLHWRPTGLFLARQFLDFEPGIHWSQMQMQSGTTGINAIRIYSPTKQAKDQDPDGTFIRHWCPELALVPLELLAEPWKLTPALQTEWKCTLGVDYPLPVVEEKSALKFAKDQIYGLRQTALAQQESARIMDKHGSRKGGLPQAGSRAAKPKTPTTSRKKQAESSPQGDLF